jgi:hypothetical protein
MRYIVVGVEFEPGPGYASARAAQTRSAAGRGRAAAGFRGAAGVFGAVRHARLGSRVGPARWWRVSPRCSSCHRSSTSAADAVGSTRSVSPRPIRAAGWDALSGPAVGPRWFAAVLAVAARRRRLAAKLGRRKPRGSSRIPQYSGSRWPVFRLRSPPGRSCGRPPRQARSGIRSRAPGLQQASSGSTG